MSGWFENVATQAQGGGQPTLRGFKRQLGTDLGLRSAREGQRQGAFDTALNDPFGTANRFQDFFRQAAEGYTAPALRDFRSSLGTIGANVAARFGGNGSSEEMRASQAAGDLFSRNLTESLSRLAPQAAATGLQYTGLLGSAAGQAADQSDRLRQLLLSALIGAPQQQTDWGQILGQLGGIALSAAL